MTKNVRAAIEATIVRWAKIATAKDPQQECSDTHCPLCEVMGYNCEACPAYNGKGFGNSCIWPWLAVNVPPRFAAWAVHDYAVSLLYQRED